MKLSVNEAKLTGCELGNFAAIQLVLNSKFAFGPEKVSDEKRAPVPEINPATSCSAVKHFTKWASPALIILPVP